MLNLMSENAKKASRLLGSASAETRNKATVRISEKNIFKYLEYFFKPFPP